MSSQSIREISILVTCGLSASLMVLFVQDFALRRLSRFGLRHFVVLFLLLRLGAFVAIYLIYGFEPTGDLFSQARQVGRISGGQAGVISPIPGYGVLFPYVMTLATAGTGNKLLVDLFWICCDCLVFVVGDKLLAIRSAPKMTSVYRITYVLCPISWFLVVGLGQDEPLLALMGELTLLATVSSLSWLGGILAAFAMAMTKLISGLYGFGGWLASRNKVQFLLTFLIAVVALFAPFWYSGVPPPLGEQYTNSPPSVNVWMVLWPDSRASPVSLWLFPVALVGFMLACVAYVRLKRGSAPSFSDISYLILANWLVFFLLAPKSLPTYRLAVLPLLLMYAASRIASGKGFAYLLGAYSLCVSIHYTFWEDWVQRGSYFADTSSVFVYALAVVIVGTEIAVLLDLLRRLAAGFSCRSHSSVVRSDSLP